MELWLAGVNATAWSGEAVANPGLDGIARGAYRLSITTKIDMLGVAMTGMEETARGRSLAQRAVGLVALVLALGVIAVVGLSTWHGLAEVAPGKEVPVELRLSHEQARMVFGLDRDSTASEDISVNSITVPVQHPSTPVLRALWAQLIVRFVVIAAGAVIAASFLGKLARGRLGRGTATLAFVGAGLVATDAIAQAMLERAASSEIRSQLFDRSLEGAHPPVDLAPLGWIMFLVALGCALLVGERLRRETDGLV